VNIQIDPSITDKTPNFHIGVLTANVNVQYSEKLDRLIATLEEQLEQMYDISDVIKLSSIAEARDAYKAYGKDPSRYRLAVESLYRRIVKGNKLYRINNVVDSGNVLSIQTRKSVAVLDKKKIKGDIIIRLGKDTDHFEGIGRGSLNVTNIPLYEDSIGPFGSTTSDTNRTKITDNTTEILVFIIAFSNGDDLRIDLDNAIDIFTTYANASSIKTSII
jgi:DNA/RNA-binding domain of Phe-tRNA-synthetase-like protein